MMVVSMDHYPKAATNVHDEYGENRFTSISTPVNNAMESSEADTTYTSLKLSGKDVSSLEVATLQDLPAAEEILTKQLKDFIGLQLDLIEYQQVKIISRDKQIMTLRNEKEQLEARICRMERRLACQKKQVDPDENQGSKLKPLPPVKNSTPVHTPTASVKIDTHHPYKPQLPVTVTSRNDREFRFKTYLRTNVNYIDIPGSKLLRNFIEPLEFPVVEAAEKKASNVSVPQWKVIERKENKQSDKTQTKDSPDEDVSNDAFCKRHNKHESEEKRRKRWDLQHVRQQHVRLQQQQQQQHSNEKAKSNKSDSSHKGRSTTQSTAIQFFTSLFPNADNMMAVEVSNVVPVCVFGYPAPAVSVKELELPWFSIAKREVQIRQAKEKLTKKNCKLGFSSKKKKSINTDVVHSS